MPNVLETLFLVHRGARGSLRHSMDLYESLQLQCGKRLNFSHKRPLGSGVSSRGHPLRSKEWLLFALGFARREISTAERALSNR